MADDDSEAQTALGNFRVKNTPKDPASQIAKPTRRGEGGETTSRSPAGGTVFIRSALVLIVLLKKMLYLLRDHF